MSNQLYSVNEELNQSLVSPRRKANKEEQHSSIMKRIKEFLFKNVQTCQRQVHLNGKVTPTNNQTNLVKNTKYNIFTFLPLVLKNQFRHFFNLFFLVNALAQLCPMLRVGVFFACIGPLLLVLTLTMCKEAYDDLITNKRDIQANSKQYDVITSSGFKKIKSKQLKVGDLVKVVGGDRIPADMIILHSEDKQGVLFLKTDQLDGQTDWKLRKAVKTTQSLRTNNLNVQKLLQSDHFCLIEQSQVYKRAPNGQIYNFQGVFDNSLKLTLQNTMWANTVLTNGAAIGLVIYIGKQTRISQGGLQARVKFGILDRQINFVSKILFIIMVLLTILFLVLKRTEKQYIPVQFMRMLILLSSIIPISMRVNLDFAKLFYSFLINKDQQINGAIARNTNCPEQLGRVKYILSDKTGTLTKNEMTFKQISIDYQTKITSQQTQNIKQYLKDACGSIKSGINSRQNSVNNIILSLSLCHNVTIVTNQEQSKRQLQASSPDEIAFVQWTQSLGVLILQRTQSSIKVKLPNGLLLSYEIKYIFPFKSQSKRMGIIVKNIQSEEYIFFLKGADMVIKQFITNTHKKLFIQQECKQLSFSGLRTLVFAYKHLSREFYDQWSQKYNQSYNQLQSNQKDIEAIIRQLQFGAEFLGITGIEDKLQNDLTQTIECLRAAGIKIWMITGDKMETAQCIGRSCGLQRHHEMSFKICNITNQYHFQEQWTKFKGKRDKMLIIDGQTLSFILNNKNISKDFFKTTIKLESVICCRCSPSQKKLILEAVKKHTKDKQAVLGIGDGGNDVGMIQSADVGIGIVGKQGMQAALAADFSIKEFSHLKNLLFWHGRLSYIRSSLLASFIIHRGFIIATIQIIFSCIFYYVSIPVFNSYLQLGYATIFTFWPVFALILSKDLSLQLALKYPKLYESLQRQEYLSVSNFLFWIWKAVFQAAIIVILTLLLFDENSYLQFQTISFSVLIITEYFMTATEVSRLHFYLIYCIIGSLLCYIACLIFLKSYLHIVSLTFEDVCLILLIFAASWGPLLIWKLIRKKCWPNEVQKIMKESNLNFIDNEIFERATPIKDSSNTTR